MSPIIRYTSLFSLLFLVASPAMAYIGPGAGLSLLGALWGLVAAVGAALLFVLLWPLRRMMRRRREAKQAETIQKQEAQQGVKQEAQQTAPQNRQKSETPPLGTVAHKATEHGQAPDPAVTTPRAPAAHEDEKKPSDVGSR